MTPLRVFVVDDSRVSRMVLGRLLSSTTEFTLVGEAINGRAALRDIPRLRPDLVLMDVMMPGMDGLTTTRHLLEDGHFRVVLISDADGAALAANFALLQAGALDLLRKPTVAEAADAAAAGRFARRLRALCAVPLVTRTGASLFQHGPGGPPHPPHGPAAAAFKPALVCVGASTGGPPALLKVFRSWAPCPPWPVLVVQHMTSGFTVGLARWLAEESGVTVVVASAGAPLTPGTVMLAPDERHLQVVGGRVFLADTPPDRGHRPSADVLFDAVIDDGWGSRTLGVLLTGMGEDGARGLGRLRQAGGWTVAQDEGSSVVYGMPRAAMEMGAACESLPLDQIGPRALHLTGSSR